MVRSAVLAASFPPPLLCPLRPISVAAATLESPIFPPVEVFEKIAMGPGAPFWTDMENHILCKVINIIMMGEPEMEDLYHGTFIIREVNCVQCFKLLGLYYITSDNPRFCYIEGNFLLQREALNRWDHGIRVAH
ncbi:uncharacterized protein LOC122076905 isoform X2 [Macadamia integrifolia]|uniref:uncharacterized protein LOC122076905 isoform X2 n=1 Tax=Macadamia integrifolia TaxID=60698 RepID=UPI001C4EB968|nr:uncharacterized protein LOC122076905 isoform X2 [Macadamia integrifolia]